MPLTGSYGRPELKWFEKRHIQTYETAGKPSAFYDLMKSVLYGRSVFVSCNSEFNFQKVGLRLT